MSSGPLTRVENGIKQINDCVDDGECGGEDERRRGNHWIVAGGEWIAHPPGKPGDAENLLEDDWATQQNAEMAAGEGDGRWQGNAPGGDVGNEARVQSHGAH